MDLKNKNFDDIRRLSQSIKSKKNILIKFFKYFSKEEIEFINNSTKLIEDFNKEIKVQEPNINEYFNGFNAINNILNSYVYMLKEQNLYISENKLREQEEETSGGEEITGGSNKEKIDVELVLTPKFVSVEEVVKALNDVNNYGAYVSNLRNSKREIDKAVENHFGPSQPWTKKAKEKERGKPFPPKTKVAVDTFIKTLTSKPNLLVWEVKGDSLVFPPKRNPTKKVTTSIIDTVMNNANIEFHLEEKETINESKLRVAIQEILRKKIQIKLCQKTF